ncbi:M14 family zinc carboxypeptidase [Idiomarina xiamenensis]|uniref:Deacylase/carboxypeptidase superfamily protein n=1 Tax=Idiomarina xiamenensis 10-D-4 TaxID=740709 RepID=K2JMJ1_9GAMM|nr:M14 family zinc carboxypeptidase [Idiomarina xiamenensis]EKE84731.1 deacylase/carboxypeptidase superfamily protein [Idiomarina xiamenensis 10-D-4]
MRRLILTSLAAIFASALSHNALAAAAQDNSVTAMWPGASYNEDSPSVERVLGYPIGSRITSPADLSQYFNALQQAYPQQVKLVEYGESWEGRRLFYAIISSADNIAQLSQFEQGMQALADPRQTSDAQAQQLIDSLPGSVWLGYGVHGNEISPPEAAMMTAYHLLAADDNRVKNFLDNTLVFIDPLQNPDGRARFVSRYYMTAGMQHSADRLSAEHNEPWPSGRSNHYLFDMNRDWIALTQPEIKGQVAALLTYYPLAFVDLHEMGGDSSYYFTPEAEPYNPFITAQQRQGLDWIGQNNAAWFDAMGFDYYTREVFDAFYPGYGASWPLYHGAIAMTYEMASARGHQFRRQDGDILTYADGVQRHFVASMATIETVSQRRQQLLQRFWQYRQSAINEAQNSEQRSWVIDPTGDAAGAHKLAALLVEQGLQVSRSEQAFASCGNDYPTGSYVIDAAQPGYRLLRTLLDPQVDMSAEFLAEQERRRNHNLADQIYDVSGWALPLLFNVDVDVCEQLPDIKQRLLQATAAIAPGQLLHADAKLGYLVKWGDMNSGRLLTAALRAGIKVKRSDLPFTHKSGDRYPAGSLIITLADNPQQQLPSKLKTLAISSGATIQGVDSSWVLDGPNFGSDNVVSVPQTNIAIAWDEPVQSLSAGHVRYVIEQQFNYPTTAIRSAQLARADLSHYQVIILPASRGGYSSALGATGVANLRDWVNRGGVLITLGNASGWAVEAGLLKTQLEKAVTDNSDSLSDDSYTAGQHITDFSQFLEQVKNTDADPYWVAGVLLNTDVDQAHWLSAGVKPQVISNYVGNQIFAPIDIQYGRNIAYYSDADKVLASGYLWQENRQQLAYKPFLMWQPMQKGMLIAFTQEPTYRAYMDGLNILFMNAIFAGAAHAKPLR